MKQSEALRHGEPPRTHRARHLRARLVFGLIGALAVPVLWAQTTFNPETDCSLLDHQFDATGKPYDTYAEAQVHCSAEEESLANEVDENGNPRYEVTPCHEARAPTPGGSQWWSGRVAVSYRLINSTTDGSVKAFNWECRANEPGEASNGDRVEDAKPDADKSTGEAPAGNGVGDPIDSATGNVYRPETDLHAGRWLSFTRYYNSRAQAASVLGPRWVHPWERAIRFSRKDGSARVRLEDGKVITFHWAKKAWVAETDVRDTLSWTYDDAWWPKSWTLKRPDGAVETYDGKGQLTKVKTAEGVIYTLSYDNDRLSQLSAPDARALRFAYDSAGHLQTVTAPDGSQVTYAYDAQGRLARISYPGGDQRQYRYDESAHSAAPANGLLTGVLDAKGERLATYDYQSDGRATGSTLGGGTQRYTLAYHSDGGSTTTDPQGVAVKRDFVEIAGVRRVSRLSGPCETCGSIAAWDYDEHGNPVSLTDFNGQRTLLAYDDRQNETERVEAAGTPEQRRILTTWSAKDQPTLRDVRDAQDRSLLRTRWRYDNAIALLPTMRCDIDPSLAPDYACPLGVAQPPAGVRITTISYCFMTNAMLGCPWAGALMNVIEPGASVIDRTYAHYTSTDESGCATSNGNCYHVGDLKSVTNALNQVTTFVSYHKNGHVTRQRDPNGVLTDLTYHPRGWLLTRTVRANVDGSASAQDATTTYTYSEDGLLQQSTDPDGVVLRYAYDAALRLTDITDALGNRLHRTYDAADRITREDVFDANGNAVRHLTRSYNTQGQLTALTDGLDRRIFDASFPDSYDKLGQLQRSADALGIQRAQRYDALGRMIGTVDNANGSDTATRDATGVFAYDAADRLLGVGDPDALNTTYEVDGFGQVAALHSPDTGNARHVYDVKGNLIERTDAKGIVSTRKYDALNRLTGVTYADSALNITYAYDEASSVTGCAASYPIGRLTRLVEANVTTVYCYDALGRVTEKRQTQGSTTDTTTYAYTRAGRLASLRTPGGSTVQYQRDAAGRISAATRDGAPLVSEVRYQPFGPVLQYTLGNGQTVTRTADANGQLTDITSPVLDLHFTRDAAGRITGLRSGSTSEQYIYDPLGRLITVKNAAGQITENYSYSKTGDRLSKTASGQATGVYSYQAGTHWLTQIGNNARSYDADGNTTGSSEAGDTWGYGYDDRTRITIVQRNGATVATYVTNAFGQRVAKHATQPQSEDQRFVYDERSQLIGEYGSTNRDYLWLDDLPIAVVDRQGGTTAVAYIHADHLNTPRAITNAQGTVVWQWANLGNAFGEQPPTSNGYVFNLRFPGQYYDAESRLHYNVHRDYDPATGRYRQSDPIGFAGGQWSSYAYVMNDPLNNTDPHGLQVASGGIPMSVISPYASGQNLSAEERNVFATGLVQLTPAGLALALTGRSFSPFGDGVTFPKDGASAWDIMNGLLNGSVAAVNSNYANNFANSYMDYRYHDLSAGNKAVRRDLLAANQMIWSESRGALNMVGKGLGPLGAVSTLMDMGQKLNAINSCAR
jgi:RHS repeat-associated protein